MATVRMLCQVSGTRNGEPWPSRGEIIDVPDDEAEGLIASNVAEPVEQKPAKGK